MAITEKYVSVAGGGAHDGSSEANAYTWAEMITAHNVPAAAGTRFNIKAGTYARTTTSDSLTGDGTATSPIIFRGYSTTPGDGYLGRTSSNGALITTNMPLITYTTGAIGATTGNFLIFESLNISGATSGALFQPGADTAITRCTVTNSSTNAAATAITAAGARNFYYDNDIALTGASGGLAAIVIGSTRLIGNRITGGPAIGVRVSDSTTPFIADNLIYACTTVGIATVGTGSAVNIYGNTIVGCGGDGIDIVTGTTGLQFIANNMITDNGGYGIDGVSAANCIFAAHNRTRDNTAGADNLATDWLAATKYSHVTTDTGGAATDYTNSGSNDYTLISASPAKGVGHFNYRDIGALQRAEPTLPAVGEVESGVQYGDGGTQYTGTLVASGGSGINELYG